MGGQYLTEEEKAQQPIMLKILQARLQQYVNRKLPDIQATSRPQHMATRVTPDMDIHLADEEGRKWRIVRTGPLSTSHIKLQEG